MVGIFRTFMVQWELKYKVRLGLKMRDDWRSAAIIGNYTDIASLLAEGTEINQRDRYGQTALMLAARHGRAKVLRLLLEYKAENFK